MKNHWRDLLGLQVFWMFPNPHWRDFSLHNNCRGHGVFDPCLYGWYKQYLTLLFVDGSDWGPLSGERRGGWDMNLMFVGGSNRGLLDGAHQGSTPPSPRFPNPSSLYFWIGFFYNFDITKIMFIVVSWGRGCEVLVAIICITIVPVVISVPYRRGFYCSSLSRPLRRGGLKNCGRTASLSASQYFNIIVWGVLVYAAWFCAFFHHPCPWNWKVRLPLFCFYPFSLSLNILPPLYLAIDWYFVDPNLLLLLPLPQPRPILFLEGATTSSSSPPSVSLIISVSLFLCPVSSHLPLLSITFVLRFIPSPLAWYMASLIIAYAWLWSSAGGGRSGVSGHMVAKGAEVQRLRGWWENKK